MTSMTSMVMSKMQCQLESYNSKLVIHEITEKFKHGSRSNVCSNRDEHSDVLKSQVSEANLNKSKPCINSLTPTNKPRLKSNLKNFFKRETKPTLRSPRTNPQCDEVPPPKEHPSEPYNLYCVPAGEDKASLPRCVDNETDIYEEVSEEVSEQMPFSRALDKTSSLEEDRAHHEAGNIYQNCTVRSLSGSQVCTARKNRKPPNVTEYNSPDDSEASSELELDLTESRDHTYDSVSHDYEHTETNHNLNPMGSSLCEVEPAPILPNVRKHAGSCVSRKPPPPVHPKVVYITRGSSKKIQQEFRRLHNDSTSQPGRPPPVPAQRRPSSMPPKELPEIEEELKAFRALLKQQKDVDITKIIISNVNFTGRMVDCRGGRLQLKSHGVVLCIPPGALGDEAQEIFIYVQQNLQSSHHTAKDGFVSPIVHCGTSGLKFNIPVILTFPVHVKDPSRWELKGVRQDSSTKPWDDISDRSSETLLLNDNLCTVVVDHFTGFGIVGRPTESETSCVLPFRVKVYISHDHAVDPVHGCVELRVYFCDESPQTCKSITSSEKDSKLLKDQKMMLHISESGTRDVDVTFELESLNKDWKTSFKKQVLSLERSDVRNRVVESCTLKLKIRPKDAATDSEHRQGLRLLECKISISHEDLGVTFRVVDDIDVRSGRESKNHRGMSIGIRPDDFDIMSPGRYRELSHHLDSERRWKLLVKTSFIGQYAERDFDEYVHPSTVLLGIIFSQGSILRESSMKTLEKLESMLIQCKLKRAAHIVQEELKEIYRDKDIEGNLVHPVQCSEDLHSLSAAELHRSTPPTQGKTPEENDERRRDQINTLQSCQSIQANTDQSFHLQHPHPEPTQDKWPPINSQEDEELFPGYGSAPQTNSHYQNVPKLNANVDTSCYISILKSHKK